MFNAKGWGYRLVSPPFHALSILVVVVCSGVLSPDALSSAVLLSTALLGLASELLTLVPLSMFPIPHYGAGVEGCFPLMRCVRRPRHQRKSLEVPPAPDRQPVSSQTSSAGVLVHVPR